MSARPGRDRPIVAASRLSKTFSRSGAPNGGFALREVSLSIWPGEILAVVGESGSGKTTLTRCLLGLEDVTDGCVLFDGVEIHGRRRSPEFQRRVQPIFQDPLSSLDPRWTVRRTVREALECLHIGGGRDERDRIVDQQLTRVGLPVDIAERKPHQISGGQRQRVAIAAALASRPDLLIADEPVTALDVSVQAQVLNLIADLRDELGLAVVLVSHDLSVVGYISDRVVVLRDGQVVEEGETRQVLADPVHPYSRQLIDSIPGHQRLRKDHHSAQPAPLGDSAPSATPGSRP